MPLQISISSFLPTKEPEVSISRDSDQCLDHNITSPRKDRLNWILQRVNNSDGTQNSSLWATERMAPRESKGCTFPSKPLHLTQKWKKNPSVDWCLCTGIQYLCLDTSLCIITTESNHEQNHSFILNKYIQEEVILIHTESYRQNAMCYNHNQSSSINLPSINLLSIIMT